MKLFVGNIDFTVTSEELRALFEKFGTVKSARIISDFGSSKSRGFGFVEILDKQEAAQAIEGLNGYLIRGRPLRVNEARDRS